MKNTDIVIEQNKTKRAEDIKRIFTQEKTQIVNKLMKKYSMSLITKEKQVIEKQEALGSLRLAVQIGQNFLNAGMCMVVPTPPCSAGQACK